VEIAYPDRTVKVRPNTGIVTVGARRTVQQTLPMEERLTIQLFDRMELRYAGKKLADITVD
jgi:hypothetical protein